VIGNAVLAMKMATGECEEATKPKSAAAELGSKGGKARAFSRPYVARYGRPSRGSALGR
jgi:hypothetical protein